MKKELEIAVMCIREENVAVSTVYNSSKMLHDCVMASETLVQNVQIVRLLIKVFPKWDLLAGDQINLHHIVT
jgi:hypothetical protein